MARQQIHRSEDISIQPGADKKGQELSKQDDILAVRGLLCCIERNLLPLWGRPDQRPLTQLMPSRPGCFITSDSRQDVVIKEATKNHMAHRIQSFRRALGEIWFLRNGKISHILADSAAIRERERMPSRPTVPLILHMGPQLSAIRVVQCRKAQKSFSTLPGTGGSFSSKASSPSYEDV